MKWNFYLLESLSLAAISGLLYLVIISMNAWSLQDLLLIGTKANISYSFRFIIPNCFSIVFSIFIMRYFLWRMLGLSILVLKLGTIIEIHTAGGADWSTSYNTILITSKTSITYHFKFLNNLKEFLYIFLIESKQRYKRNVNFFIFWGFGVLGLAREALLLSLESVHLLVN